MFLPRKTMGWTVLAVACSVSMGMAGCGGIVDKDARALFMQRIGRTSVTVFPAFVRRGRKPSYDPSAAQRIGQALAVGDVAGVTLSKQNAPIKAPWHMNQARMLRESAADFSAFVKENRIETNYALLAEYLIGDGDVIGVHCYVLDDAGTVAWACLWNSHHRAFAEANLKTPDDCTAFLCRELPRRLTPAKGGE